MGAVTTVRANKSREADLERARCAWLLAADLSAKAFGADVRVVMQTRGTPGRGSHDDATTHARKVACYLGLIVANVPGARLAEAALMDRATIHKHAAWVEDEREHPEFDAKVARLEKALVAMALRVVLAQFLASGEALGDVA